MPKPIELPAWLRALPAEVDEVRVMGGSHKAQLQAIGSVRVEPKTIATAHQAIEELVEQADLGPVFRCFAMAAGKTIRTGLFSPGAEGEQATSAQDALARLGPVANLEDALWRVTVAQATMLDRVLASNERLVSGLAAPLESLAHLFSGETARRQNAEDRLLDLSQENIELGGLARDLASRIDDATPDDPAKGEAIRSAVLDLVHQVGESFRRSSAAGKGPGTGSDGPQGGPGA